MSKMEEVAEKKFVGDLTQNLVVVTTDFGMVLGQGITSTACVTLSYLLYTCLMQKVLSHTRSQHKY